MVTLTEESLVLQVGGWAQGQPPNPGKNLVAKKSQSRKAGWISGQRPKRVTRNTNLWINIGIWNVMTMLKPGKTERLKVPNWKTFVQDRRRWKEVVEKAKTLH